MPASERRTLPSAIGIIATGVAVSAGIWLLYFMAVTLMMPHPIEYREGAAQVVTQLLLAGKNPFTPENQPLGMTNYGILFSLVVWPLAALFGNTLLVHRFVTVLFIVLSAYVLARTAISANQQIAVSIVGAELAAAALATRGGLGGYPSSMGAFFFLAAITVPYIRRFDRWGLVLSAAASLLALFAKPYFILGVGTVACYTFLFVSKRTGLLYALGFAAATGLAVLLVRRILPLYFYDTIFSNLSQAEQNTPAHLVRQLHQLAVEFPPLIVAGMLLMLAAVVSWKQGPGGRSGDFSVRSLLALDRGVFAHPLDYFGFTAVCTLLTFILILGPHPGNYMNYAYQLVVPVSILWLLVSLRPERSIALVVIALLIANLILFVLTRLPRGDLVQTPDSRSAWKALYGYAEACQRPLNTPPVVPVMINRGLWPQDSGHTEYFLARDRFRACAGSVQGMRSCRRSARVTCVRYAPLWRTKSSTASCWPGTPAGRAASCPSNAGTTSSRTPWSSQCLRAARHGRSTFGSRARTSVSDVRLEPILTLATQARIIPCASGVVGDPRTDREGDAWWKSPQEAAAEVAQKV